MRIISFIKTIVSFTALSFLINFSSLAMEESSPFDECPIECILNAFQYLDYKTLSLIIPRVCKPWKELADNTNLWAALCENQFSPHAKHIKKAQQSWKQFFSDHYSAASLLFISKWPMDKILTAVADDQYNIYEQQLLDNLEMKLAEIKCTNSKSLLSFFWIYTYLLDDTFDQAQGGIIRGNDCITSWRCAISVLCKAVLDAAWLAEFTSCDDLFCGWSDERYKLNPIFSAIEHRSVNISPTGNKDKLGKLYCFSSIGQSEYIEVVSRFHERIIKRLDACENFLIGAEELIAKIALLTWSNESEKIMENPFLVALQRLMKIKAQQIVAGEI